MIKQDFYIANLIARHLSGEITAEEKTKLESWKKADREHDALFQKICNEKNHSAHIEKAKQFNPESGWKEVEKRIRSRHNRNKYLKLLNYAAAIIIPIVLVSISLKYVSPIVPSDKEPLVAQSIYPGESKAILTLDNGETIHIDKTVSNIVQKLDGTQIKVDSTTLNYHQSTPSLSTKKEPIYNKVEIPRGGEYALVLSDGTKVHLNSMSSLRFPISFGNGKREVELIGEAFFDVSKSGQPFIVNTNGMKVEVLGTTFNVCAYPNEEYQTTLVNGSVKVNAGEGEGCILKPSQQASIAPGKHEIQVRTVDTAFYTSWIKGKIHFKDTRLEDIMNTLSRWYDMNVVYANENIKSIRFGCNVDRYDEITPFVNLLEETEKVHIKINGKTITFYN